MRYTIHAQGCYGGPTFDTKRQAVQEVKALVKGDRIDCRRRFKTSICIASGNMWTVQAGRGDHSPMWSRYTIHEIP